MAGINGVNNYLYGGGFNSAGIPYGLNGAGGVFSFSANQSWLNSSNYSPLQWTSFKSTLTGLDSGNRRMYLTAVKEYGSKLRNATASLSSSSQSIFQKMMSASSKSDSLSVSVAKQAEAKKFSDAKGVKDVTIRQLASTQQNTGTSLNATALSSVSAGVNHFTIAKDTKTYNFTVDVKLTDSSRTVQQKAADAINKQKIGVTAAVEYDGKTNRSTLVLTSNETGARNAFTAADAAGGRLISTLGVGQATNDARDAIYTVNGEEKTSDKNTVDLGDGLTGTLKKVSAEQIKVTAGKDADAITGAVSDMVKQFNGLLKTATDYDSDKGAQSLRRRLDNLSAAYSASLTKIGITRNKGGYLELDEQKLREAFNNGPAERNLGSGGVGFLQRLSQLAKAADTDPSQFLSYQSRSDMNRASEGSYMSQMPPYYNTGLFLNMGV